MAWATPFAADVAGQLGVSVGAAYHLWHGSLCDRRHGLRHREFRMFDFDPTTDIAQDESRCWSVVVAKGTDARMEDYAKP
ncbi:MAG TPA: hypothetical protein VFX70_22770 [Mycobacteriales bacterium]|nr:hypothetical protein [Mycobacteriales bacterium]